MNYVLDTNVIIYAQKGILAEPLPRGQYFVSVITEIELFSHPSLNPEKQQVINDLLREVQVVGIDSRIKNRTIELRRAYRLRIPDAIIAATALETNSELLTHDTGLSAVDKLRCRRVGLLNN